MADPHFRDPSVPDSLLGVKICAAIWEMDVNKKDIAKNAGRALVMFRRLEETMSNDSNLTREYHKAMAKDFINGYLKEVGHQEVKAFMPHHGVWKDSTSTKLRMVMNFSASEPNKMSVNETCMSGPTIQSRY